MFKEFDVVIAKNELPGVPKGSIGAVLIVYEGKGDYEVEFIDESGNSIGWFTVNEKDLEKKDK
jgi:hypothetical protein